MFKLDLHCHCNEYSQCAEASACEMLEAAEKYGLDGIALTNHFLFVKKDHLAELRTKFPGLKIYNGIELRMSGEDIIYLGPFIKELESIGEDYERLYHLAGEAGGCLILAHPFRFSEKVALDVGKYSPDFLEIHSSNIGVDDEERIKTFANKFSIKTMANSDAHVPGYVGIYHSLYPDLPENEAELAVLLKNSQAKWQGNAERIKAANRWTSSHEEEIRQLIKAGGTGEDYETRYKRWAGYYNRVKSGKSYCM